MALQTGALRSSAALRRDPEALSRSLEVVRTSALAAMADMRRLIDVLRTDAPDQHEDVAWEALSARLKALRPQTTIEIDPAAAAQLESAGIEAQALRIGQEGVTNLLKHSGPGPVTLQLTEHGGSAVLEIRSPPPEDPAHDHGSGLGLASMRRRAEQTGGAVQIGPIDKRTWRVRANWPGEALREEAAS